MGHIISLTVGSVEVTLDRDLTQMASEGALFLQDRYILHLLEHPVQLLCGRGQVAQ